MSTLLEKFDLEIQRQDGRIGPAFAMVMAREFPDSTPDDITSWRHWSPEMRLAFEGEIAKLKAHPWRKAKLEV